MFSHLFPNFLTKIRNASLAKKKEVTVALSNLSVAVVKILREEGNIRDFTVQRLGHHFSILLRLSYSHGIPTIQNVRQYSKSGLRSYVGRQQLGKSTKNPGVTIVTTTKGLMTGKTANHLGIGGEMLCSVS